MPTTGSDAFRDEDRARILDLLAQAHAAHDCDDRGRHARARELRRQAHEIREASLRRFAGERGFTVGRRPFTAGELVEGRRHGSPSNEHPEIDHPDYLRERTRPFRPAALITHSYCEAKALFDFANDRGLSIEFLPWSWYWPGACLAAMLIPRPAHLF